MSDETTIALDNEREIALIKATAEIVAAAAAKGMLTSMEIQTMIAATKTSLAAPATRHDPFKSLKRHIMVHYGLTPDEYRTKWGLPASYPMVAPNYAAARSELAKRMGLGRTPKRLRAA